MPFFKLDYFNDPERTAAAFDGGWFHSGSLAPIDEEGFITVVNHGKGTIKTGGESVASFKAPKRVVFADALPKNPIGKVLKQALRIRFATQMAPAHLNWADIVDASIPTRLERAVHSRTATRFERCFQNASIGAPHIKGLAPHQRPFPATHS